MDAPGTSAKVVPLFRGTPIPAALPTANWRDNLILNDEGHPRAKPINNAIWFLRGEPRFQDLFGYDEFAHDVFLAARPPWLLNGGKWEPRSITDEDITHITAQLEKCGLQPTKNNARDAVTAVAMERHIHPVRHYLDALKWDEVPRLQGGDAVEGSAPAIYLGSEDTLYAREAFKRWMISAIARIYRPGCKADHALVLEGPQGKLKSTALKTMADPFFTDELADFGSKDSAMQLQGAWVIELAELDALRGNAAVERIKAFMSRTTDRFRPPYGGRVKEFPRSCVFAGTTNSDHYLKDMTGNRRFWPIRCGEIDIKRLRSDRDQLWAEAKHLYDNKEIWWLTGDAADIATEEQAERVEEEPWAATVLEYLSGTSQTKISTTLILRDALHVEIAKHTRSDATRIGTIMRQAKDWARRRRRDENGNAGVVYVKRGSLDFGEG